MKLEWKVLDWDSEFLGNGIGRVELNGADAASLAKVEAEARASGVICLYGYLDPVEYQTTHFVQTMGYRLVESSTLFDLDNHRPTLEQPTNLILRAAAKTDLPIIGEALDLLAPWSRFAVDPRFGLAVAKRMNRAWIERAALCTDGGYRLIVAECEGVITAFMSSTLLPRPIADIVGTTQPGSGAARALMQEARVWAGEQTLWAGWAAARNVNSFRFCESAGCRTAAVRYVYHRWLDDDGVGLQ